MKWQRALGLALLALGFVGMGLMMLFDSAIIISLGIRASSFLTALDWLIFGLGSGNLFLSFVPEIKEKLNEHRSDKLLQEKIDNDNEQTADYETNSLDPEKVRVRLEQLRDRNPNLNTLMVKCLVQKDEIDRYQEQLERLLKANEALYLNDIPAVLDSAEERICANFRDIINCCILVEYNGQEISERNQSIVQDALKSNDEELEAVEILLDRSVAYINDYNRKGISDRQELDAWIKAMEKKINREGEISLD